MAKNNHGIIDITESLDSLFSAQFVSSEESDERYLEKYLGVAATYAQMESCIAVLSDLKTRCSYIFYGGFGEMLGIAPEGSTKVLDTIWEEEILCRVSREDLDRKQIEEMKFFSFVTRHQADGHLYFMNSSFPMTCANGDAVIARHRIFYFHLGHAVRYALCLYNASASILPESTIVNMRTGEEIPLCVIDYSNLLSEREKQILRLISEGLSSKEVADRLGISVYTVSRHRQNIIAAMNVKNSSQACLIAHRAGLI